ncbi:hypothetical protein IFM89_032934 [Coptis chinensis]|uniref:MICOS complex subunit MIC60 n=1 Tax=Coptis chinensis TaxID=261450 RepID=A0A835I6K6_9MAGN|nr:hypothetical protein IFM89_032934 [Coptis chinensis]
MPTPTQQRPYHVSSRKEFSASSQPSPKPTSGSVEKPPEASGSSNVGKLVLGGVLLGGCVGAAAYQHYYLNKPTVEEEPTSIDNSSKIPKGIEGLGDQVTDYKNQGPNVSNNSVVDVGNNGEAHLDSTHILDEGKVDGENQAEGGLNETGENEAVRVHQKELPSFSLGGMSSDDQSYHSKTSSGDTLDKKEVESGFINIQSSREENEVVNATSSSQEPKEIAEEINVKEPPVHQYTDDAPKASLVNGTDPSSSLTDLYFLGEKDGGDNATSLDGKVDSSITHTKQQEASVGASEELKDAYISKDGNLVLDFLEAIHAAEERQAELDAHILAEEKRKLKEKFEKELKDARARELMYAEEASMLDKELNKERTKAAATFKSLKEKAEENLKMELERKEGEVEMQLKKVKELAQAELAAAIANEKASQIEKMTEANLNVALALEDAVSKGLPIQPEISALHTYLEGIDKDSLLDLVLSSLPEEALKYGTKTELQLKQKANQHFQTRSDQFDALKGTLRHYSLIPPGGGGILAHSLAHIASLLKVKENNLSGDGIESIISRVENFLAEGKLAEAADALEGGVNGTQAEEVISEWVNLARNRAITEQALLLLQSYATSISAT